MIAAAGESPAKATSVLDRLLTDSCKKATVLLGEDGHHGSGKTLAVKVELVERLVNECGFNAVYFESSIYDFIDLQRQLDHRSASPEMLADAIGGLWSTTREIDPLIAFLYEKANTGKVYLAGLDPQLGSATSVYTKSALPEELGAFLADSRREQCSTAIKRMTNWSYDDDQQYLDARAELRDCAIEIQMAIARRGKSKANASAAHMNENFLRHIDLISDDSLNKRDKAMYDNFVWHRSQRPDRARIIVWCATVHAAKDVSLLGKDRRSLGSFIHSLQKNKAATIGFTALGGSYGRNKQITNALEPAASDSLESRAFEGTKDDIVYLDHEQLNALDTISARALDYAKPMTTDWAELVDGMIVLRNEQQPHFVRSARPQQATHGKER
ncbi:MAG: erythromycin esterase family protein [Dokdonella sp.]